MDRNGVPILKTVLIFLMTLSLYADTTAYIKAKIIQNIIKVISKKNIAKVCNKDPNFQDIFQQSDKLINAPCKSADFIITSNSSKYKKYTKKDKFFIISTDYRDYVRNKKTDIAAFFWQKGRPNVIFNGKILRKMGIKLPKIYRNYIE